MESRKPLVLASTRQLLDSVLNSAKSGGSTVAGAGRDGASVRRIRPSVRLKAGILRLSGEGAGTDLLRKDSDSIGVSASVLKRLSVTSGSLVLVKNAATNVGRVARVLVLDHPVMNVADVSQGETVIGNNSYSRSSHVMTLLPSFTYPSNNLSLFDQEVAYVSSLLAFNLGLHISCLKVLVHGGHTFLSSLFEGEELDTERGNNDSVDLELEPWFHLPRYATHLRVSFVKIPECGMLESLRGSSKTEADDHQDMIDSALNDYFTVDRFLARGDLFCVHINTNCGSEICIACSADSPKRFNNNFIYFKVMAMEPINEPILRINCSQTALVLGGSAASAIPPDSFIGHASKFMPLQGDTVKLLATVLAPTLCPSALSSKFRVNVFLYGPSGCGKRTVVNFVARRLGLHVVECSCHDLMGNAERKVSSSLANIFKTARRYSPSILLLRHFDVFGNLSNEGSPLDQVGIFSEVASVIREFTEPVSEDEDLYSGETSTDGFYIVERERVSRHTVLLIAAADSSDGLQPSVRRCFSHEISMGSLSEEQRVTMLSQLLRGARINDQKIHDEILKDMVGQSSGFMPRDIHALIADASANFVRNTLGDNHLAELEENGDIKFVQDANISHRNTVQHLEKKHFSIALERSKKRNASALGTPKVPNVKWEDVGGLEEVKKSILDTVQLPLLHKDLFSSGLRKRSGVLFYGPPGTGKTLLAKAVATECSLNFLSVKGPELINMYIGESEKNIRDIFQKARSARPCVIFFDELDSLAPARGASGDSGGVMDRVVSQMLAEIDGLNEASQDLFIIGASNRPDLIDPALLRPGRFDKLLYVGVNSDASYRERVLTALTRKFKLHENVSLISVARRCPPNFTGADMYALCADAWFHAAKRKVAHTTSDFSCANDDADTVVVEIDDFMKVLGELSPSLSMAELKKYELLRDQFEGTTY